MEPQPFDFLTHLALFVAGYIFIRIHGWVYNRVDAMLQEIFLPPQWLIRLRFAWGVLAATTLTGGGTVMLSFGLFLFVRDMTIIIR